MYVKNANVILMCKEGDKKTLKITEELVLWTPAIRHTMKCLM